jgi:hypothetical protein
MGDGQLSVRRAPLQPAPLPDSTETTALLKLIELTYPDDLAVQSRLTIDAARLDLVGPNQFRQQFRAAMTFAAFAQRTDALDMSRSIWWWLEECRDWLRATQTHGSSLIHIRPFVAAMIAAGVGTGPVEGRIGVLELALRPNGFHNVPSAGWRDVLAHGLRKPLPLPDRATPALRPSGETYSI